MRLAELFAAIAPFLEGREEHAAAARALYGERVTRDSERLAIYGRFCRRHRFNAVDYVFADTRASVIAARGEASWETLVERYFRAHRMHHVELNENGGALPAFLAADESLPGWVAELADLEWWEWRTTSALDDPRDRAPAQGALRLASTVELRSYQHDLVGWLDAEDRAAAPAAQGSLVIFWRDLDGDTRREEATTEELAVLKAVTEAARVPDAVADELADLRAAGIVLGAG